MHRYDHLLVLNYRIYADLPSLTSGGTFLMRNDDLAILRHILDRFCVIQVLTTANLA